MVQKVVINTNVGGMALSEAGVEWLRDAGLEEAHDIVLPGEMFPDGSGPAEPTSNTYPINHVGIDRDNELLVECVETLGDDAAGEHADLTVAKVPDGRDWQVVSSHGAEELVIED